MEGSPGAEALQGIAEALAREVDGAHTAAGVAACVQHCHQRLVTAGVEEDLTARTEALARAVLHHPSSAGRWGGEPATAGHKLSVVR